MHKEEGYKYEQMDKRGMDVWIKQGIDEKRDDDIEG